MDEKTIIYTAGGPVYKGCTFHNTEFVAQKLVLQCTQETKREQNESKSEQDKPEMADYEPIELCHFIHPAVVEEKQKMQIHREVENLVRSNTVPNICAYLNEMAQEKKILLPIESKMAMKELQRMGMPGEDKEGFSLKNFQKYYRK